jgi:ABC-type transport system involved in multi-copper enzyme maturation permease subunit
MYSLRSPDTAPFRRVPVRPLLAKELREVLNGRALWTMLILLCPLVGYSFFQATSLYREASAAARDSPAMASGLSPLDGVLVPTFGAFYLAVTLLFPFVAIRVLGREKETGALRLLLQLPYRTATLIAAKMAAVATAWVIALIPALSTLALWEILGGHLSPPETINLLGGHLLYGSLIGAIALFSAAISESAATAAIITLSFTIGSWVIDFALAGQPGVLGLLSRLSLTQTLRTFEQGLLSAGLVVGLAAAILGFCVLAGIWLHPGMPVRRKVLRSVTCAAVMAALLMIAARIGASADLAEDRRNSFPAADQRELAKLNEPLVVTVHLAPEDPRYADLRRNVLAKLERVVPHATIRLASGGQTIVGSSTEQLYGEIEYSYAGRSLKSRSTSHREALPVLYELAGRPPPTPIAGEDYPGYPLVAEAQGTLPWFFAALPLSIVLAWWWISRPPRIPTSLAQNGGSL